MKNCDEERREAYHAGSYIPSSPLLAKNAPPAPDLENLGTPPKPGLGNPLSSMANESVVIVKVGVFEKSSRSGDGEGRPGNSLPTGDASDGDCVEEVADERDLLDLDLLEEDFFFVVGSVEGVRLR
ncbi:hypothetical protein MPER_04244 [Moniliophthora perniciosa FA553]|nr:hypothetical protein MPER_04244 [Moniliophthora perniciosa FA553]